MGNEKNRDQEVIMKKEVAIVFGITSDYVFALANVLIGMKRHHKKPFWDDIIIYHDGVSESDQEKINTILKCTFIKFDTNEIEKYGISQEAIKNYSLMSLTRLVIFNLLNEYHKVIWHDVDILIQKDFSGLMDYADKSGLAMTITDANFLVESNFYKLIPGYSMYTPLYNAGIMVISDKLKNYKKAAQWCLDKTKELASDLRYMDQGILNLFVQEFDVAVEEIDILKYCCHPERPSHRDAAIIHAYGHKKFWNNDSVSKKFPEWQQNNEEWIRISANDYKLASTQDKVSIVMSVYDRSEYLEESVNSLLNQTYNNIEIIIVVEYSERQQQLNKQIEKIGSDKIKIINNRKRLGFAASLNVALKKATGVYIARMDDDDISEPERIAKQVAYLEANPDIGVVGSYAQCFGRYTDKWHAVPTDPDLSKIQLLFKTALYHPTVMMRAEILRKHAIEYDPDYFAEDYELWSRIIKYTKIANIPEYLLRYRTSGQNATTNNPHKIHNAQISIMEKQFKQYLGLNLTIDELQAVNGRIDYSESVYNPAAFLALRQKVYEKIVKANAEKNFYDQAKLKQQLEVAPTSVLKRYVRRGAKKTLRPIIDRFDRFVRWRLIELDDRLSKAEAEIRSLKDDT
ncbi:MAG: glycosyltransferase [Candidatus Microsaccharimonas sp.]